MAIPATKTRISREEYLRVEELATDKHEYHAGEILAMSGGTYKHSRITANLLLSLGTRLRGTKCFTLESNMRVWLAEESRYVYPDAQVVCGKPQFDPVDKKQTTIINPRLVFEVLSESTEAYDRGAKFTAYRGLASLEEFILVSQSEPLIEMFRRQPDGNWLFSVARGIDAIAKLTSMQIDLPLAEVYEGIEFPSSEPE